MLVFAFAAALAVLPLYVILLDRRTLKVAI